MNTTKKVISTKVKVSVIITARNYAKYLPKCLESVIRQKFESWELVVVNDGSTDHTSEIVNRYKIKYPEKIKSIQLKGVGLAKACNIGIKEAKGRYIIRLDADDYFDENILIIECNILDNEPDIHMVYPDYYEINKHGEIIDAIRLSKINDEIKLLDRNPLAAGAMYRKECFIKLGGYNEDLCYQEDFDFWLRFIDRFNVYNVNLPLLYYRRHNKNMSNNFRERMKARQYVKEKYVREKNYGKGMKIIGVIPAMGLFRNREKLSLKRLCGKKLIDFTIEEAFKSKHLERVVVSTEDQEIAENAIKLGVEVPFMRPIELCHTSIPIEDVLRHMLFVLNRDSEETPDIIVILPYECPFRSHKHIDEAIDTLLIYDTDSVISVTVDLSFHWKPGKYGLIPVGYKTRLLREDKETMYKENAAIYVIRSKNLGNGDYLGKSIGHIEMSKKDSWRIESELDFMVAEKLLNDSQI